MRCPKGLRSIGSNISRTQAITQYAISEFQVKRKIFLVKISFICMRMKNHFVSKSFAPSLALKPEAWCNSKVAYYHDNAKNSSGRRSANMTDD